MQILNIVGKQILYQTQEELEIKLENIHAKIKREQEEAQLRWVNLNCQELMVRQFLLSLPKPPLTNEVCRG